MKLLLRCDSSNEHYDCGSAYGSPRSYGGIGTARTDAVPNTVKS
jgi:hypothetical protein